MRLTHFVSPDFLLLPHMGEPRKSLKKKKQKTDTAILIVLPHVWRTGVQACVPVPTSDSLKQCPFPGGQSENNSLDICLLSVS